MADFRVTQIEQLQQLGRDLAETEASIWEDQNDAANTQCPRRMADWQRGTFVADHMIEQLDEPLTRDEDGCYSEDVTAVERIVDDAAAARWAELAEAFNAGHEARVHAWRENQDEEGSHV